MTSRFYNFYLIFHNNIRANEKSSPVAIVSHGYNDHECRCADHWLSSPPSSITITISCHPSLSAAAVRAESKSCRESAKNAPNWNKNRQLGEIINLIAQDVALIVLIPAHFI